MYRLELESATVRDLATIADFLDTVGRACGLGERTLYHIKVSVDEACSNVFEHAYDGQAGRICLDAHCLPELVTVRIHDWGRAFDPSSYRPPDLSLPLHERPIGGLGLHFIYMLMDEVEYTFDAVKGNCLTLRKKRGA